jgi:PilZ domain
MSELSLLSQAEKKKRPSERRATVRYYDNMGDLCAVVSSYERVWALVRDISASGIGLILNGKIEPGTPLTIEMRTQTQGRPFALLARVAHATKRSEFSWLVGCELLTRLSAERLRELLSGD